MNRISQLRYAITNPLHIYRRPVKYLAFWQTVQPISHCCLSGQHSDTRGTLGDRKALNTESPDFEYHEEIKILNLNADFVGNTSYYVTTTAFLTFPINHKLQNAQRSDQHSVHKINPDIHLICELHVTVQIYTVTCSLSDADSHSILIRGTRVRAVSLMSVPLQNNMYCVRKVPVHL
jgi:hypothetical protein